MGRQAQEEQTQEEARQSHWRIDMQIFQHISSIYITSRIFPTYPKHMAEMLWPITNDNHSVMYSALYQLVFYLGYLNTNLQEMAVLVATKCFQNNFFPCPQFTSDIINLAFLSLYFTPFSFFNKLGRKSKKETERFAISSGNVNCARGCWFVTTAVTKALRSHEVILKMPFAGMSTTKRGQYRQSDIPSDPHLCSTEWASNPHTHLAHRRLPYLSYYRIFLPENNSAHYFKGQAERMFTWELLAALSDKRQGHTSGIIASTEWELPAGSSVMATWPRLPCSQSTNTAQGQHSPGLGTFG